MRSEEEIRAAKRHFDEVIALVLSGKWSSPEDQLIVVAAGPLSDAFAWILGEGNRFVELLEQLEGVDREERKAKRAAHPHRKR